MGIGENLEFAGEIFRDLQVGSGISTLGKTPLRAWWGVTEDKPRNM